MVKFMTALFASLGIYIVVAMIDFAFVYIITKVTKDDNFEENLMITNTAMAIGMLTAFIIDALNIV